MAEGFVLFELDNGLSFSRNVAYDSENLALTDYVLNDLQRAEKATLTTEDGRHFVIKDRHQQTPYELCSCGEGEPCEGEVCIADAEGNPSSIVSIQHRTNFEGGCLKVTTKAEVLN